MRGYKVNLIKKVLKLYTDQTYALGAGTGLVASGLFYYAVQQHALSVPSVLILGSALIVYGFPEAVRRAN